MSKVITRGKAAKSVHKSTLQTNSVATLLDVEARVRDAVGIPASADVLADDIEGGVPELLAACFDRGDGLVEGITATATDLDELLRLLACGGDAGDIAQTARDLACTLSVWRRVVDALQRRRFQALLVVAASPAA
jgi:hypothetical protein